MQPPWTQKVVSQRVELVGSISISGATRYGEQGQGYVIRPDFSKDCIIGHKI